MSAVVRIERENDTARLSPEGAFDLSHATDARQAVATAESDLAGCRLVDLSLAGLHELDGSGAVLLARMLDRLEAGGSTVRVVEGTRPEAARLIALYREHRSGAPKAPVHLHGVLARIGSVTAQIPGFFTGALDFTGRAAVTVPATMVAPGTVDWRALPRLVQAIGADGLPVAGAANLLVGLIIGFLGVSQLGRFGATAFVPELVVVAQLRELGPLVTAIVVAGRSGAGLASEIATMKVSEEIDALQVMGFDPMRWLVVPRCLALIIALPLLTWIGDVLALVGGLVATMALTPMSPRAYLISTADAITAAHFLTGMAKTPFLGLAIGLIACGQGLATYGGAAAVGTRTTAAVVLAIFAAIVISSLFTLLFVLIGV
jgi:phospholipid/cholesterol/gamma-HCH transport system permease protein